MALASESEAVALPVFSWNGCAQRVEHLRATPSIGRRVGYALMEPGMNCDSGAVSLGDGGAVVRESFVLTGVPTRNQVVDLELEWGDSPFVLTLRDTDTFGEVLIHLDPSRGSAAAYSITIDRVLKGGVSYPSPRPEEQVIERIGRFEFAPVGAGQHLVRVKAVEEDIRVSIDGAQTLRFVDPDIAAGCLGIGTWESLRVLSIAQNELVSRAEAESREEFLARMNDFCRGLDADYESDIAGCNELTLGANALTWRYRETGATVQIKASPGSLTATMSSGLYGNARLLEGVFAHPKLVDDTGMVYGLADDETSALEGDANHLRMTAILRSEAGREATVRVTARFTENATWFWTAEVDGITVKSASLAFGLDNTFADRVTAGAVRDQSDGFLCTDGVVGHYWKALNGQDTAIDTETVDGASLLVLRSQRAKFRWATMWLPYHKLNLTGYKKRMVHFIRCPETPNHEWRERPSVCEYPTDEELERFAANGAKAMVWHHTWTGCNFRRREGFIVNDAEMRRAMKKAHDLGIAVILYIGIVPGRHPVLRYEDLSTRSPYDKNWDLQDYTFYAVAGRFAEFLPYMTDYWCREYGIDGFYSDGGLALVEWGYTGLSEDDFEGLSLEELNDRFYSRVRRVLRRNRAGFGLENWGSHGVHFAVPFYDCRMIGEAFQETSPESYRDIYNPLITSTPFKMYAMDLVARNRYNVAMAAVCMADLQICSGNYAWGCWPDRPSDWANIRPFWEVLDSIDWDHLIDAKPWWAQKLVSGDGFYAGHYTTPDRVVLFLANRTEEKSRVKAVVNVNELPEKLRKGRISPIYPERGEWSPLRGAIEVDLPRLHDGPVGFEIAAASSSRVG